MPRFHLNQGASEGTWQGETPGVSFVGHTDRKVAVFEVAAGYRAAVTCVDMQHGASVTVSPEGHRRGAQADHAVQRRRHPLRGVLGQRRAAAAPARHPDAQLRLPDRERPVPRALRVQESKRHRDRSCGRRAQRLHARPGQPRSAEGLRARLSDQRLRGRLRRDETITWTLTGQSVSASSSETTVSRECCASTSCSRPRTTPDSSTMHIDSAQLLRAQNTRVLPTTGDTTVPPGDHTVSETAIAPTSLADYDSSVVCRTGRRRRRRRRAGHRDVAVVPVRSGEHVVCVFLNSRKGAPPPGARRGSRDHQGGEPEPRTARSDGHVDGDVEEQGARDGDERADRGHAARRRQVRRGLTCPFRQGVTCVGSVCTLASLAAGAVRHRDVPDDGDAGRLRRSTSWPPRRTREIPTPADNAASAELAVEGTNVEVVEPLLECVEELPNGRRRAHFGYSNSGGSTDVIPLGDRNKFDPLPRDRGQPDQFVPGRVIDAFQVDFDEGTHTWTLGSRQVAASAASPPCAATIRIDKTLEPTNDLGPVHPRDRRQRGRKRRERRRPGHNGRRHRRGASAGSLHTVGERAVGNTNADDYATTIVCRADRGAGAELGASNTRSLAVRVAPGQEVVCTIRNVRTAPTPPTPPGPEPPVPPEPPPIPPTPLPPIRHLRVRSISRSRKSRARSRSRSGRRIRRRSE